MAEMRERVLAARSSEELAGAMEAEGAPKWLMFWGHQADASGLGKGCLSQWWPSRFTVDGAGYASAEHWMMAEKASLFGDAAARERILAARTPAEAKALGRLVQGFDDAVWEAARFEIVVAGSVHKFGARDDLRAYLLGTRGRVLVEASPRDRIWGIGMSANHENAADPRKWRGTNLLGFALMEARERLAAVSAE
jgi:ribA/ribD-fused uncharacterized protein